MAREQDGGALRQHTLKGGCAKHPVVIRMNAEVASLHAFPVAETVDNVRKQQTLYARVRCGSVHRRGISGDRV